jgi:hypothetical protein
MVLATLAKTIHLVYITTYCYGVHMCGNDFAGIHFTGGASPLVKLVVSAYNGGNIRWL